MSVYTISPNLLRNIEKDEGIYFSDILFVFTQRTNPYKVSRDKKGDIISCYESIEENAFIIKTWLDLMSFKPSPFETIDIDLENIGCEETKFLKLCKATNGQNKLILYSNQDIKKFRLDNGLIIFEDIAISILDRDLARNELNEIIKSGDTYINSQVAKNNSNISDSNNK